MKRTILTACILTLLLLTACGGGEETVSVEKEPFSATPLEEHYQGRGEYTVKQASLSDGWTTIWYPEEEGTYPLILIGNPTGAPATTYPHFFERLASWGFVVAGNEEQNMGSGGSLSSLLDTSLAEGRDPASPLYGKIDEEHIGIFGYSQGGVGAVNAVTKYPNGSKIDTLFTASAVDPKCGSYYGWFYYDPTNLTIPCFIMASTGLSDDSGGDRSTGQGGWAPLESLKEMYDILPDDVMKVRARARGSEHGDMIRRTPGYLTAWMLYQLKGDEEAGQAFLGEDAEILKNPRWQDVEKNR